jgi:hypothetical protein
LEGNEKENNILQLASTMFESMKDFGLEILKMDLPSWFFWSHLGPEFLCLLVFSVARMTTHT